MKDSKEVLTSILKTTQMGQVGIRSVLRATLKDDLRSNLQLQLKEYDEIEREAQSIASSRGWVLEELDPTVKLMSGFMTRSRLTFGNVDSKAAAMMITGTTKGIIKGIKNNHHSKCNDDRIEQLSQKLLDCENANIRQMQRFL